MAQNQEEVVLQSLSPERITTVLDRSCPGIEATAAGNMAAADDALTALLAHYRSLHPLPDEAPPLPSAVLEQAEKIVRRTFQFGPYEEATYGDPMDWEWDPRDDIEWVASVYRFYWAEPLARAYGATRDERFARACVELVSDWIAAHPLERHERTHRVYSHWKGFAWLDIQTGIRATNLCRAFPMLVHAESFTPAFLARFLASLYDHQVKTERLPMGQVHNKAIFEQRGFINVAYTFPEFADSRRWLELGFQRAAQSLLAQTTSDGVQREWSFGYHLGVLRDAVEITERMRKVDYAIPADYRDRVHRMYDYIHGIAGPDLGAPMFGDASRPQRPGDRREEWQLYAPLMQAADLLNDSRFAARAQGDASQLPRQASSAFPEAGLYALRSGWGPEDIQLNLHCSPPAISSHDQPDNGTFELCAFGRWLMPDSGFYTYGHDPQSRAWHRRTRVHQTLTLDGRDSACAGRHLLWSSDSGSGLVAVTVANDAYEGLEHRRTIWFVQGRYFVLLDEAIGAVPGRLELHYQFAPGELRLDAERQLVHTDNAEANVALLAIAPQAMTLRREEGWHAWAYGKREPRPACSFQYPGTAPAVFLTVLVPYRGGQVPRISASQPQDLTPGSDTAQVRVTVDEQSLCLKRDLARGRAWADRA